MATLANMGTPLMWLGCGHLLFLNLLLGLIESRLICRMLRIAPRPALTWSLIAANYASASAGFFLLPVLWDRLGVLPALQPPLRTVGWMLLIMVVLSFLGTLAIEAPFALVGLRKTDKPTRRKLIPFAVSQVSTYAGLLVIYAVVSPMSAVTKLAYVEPSEIALRTDGGWVYYRGTDGGLTRTRLDGSRTESLELQLPETDGWRHNWPLLFQKADTGWTLHSTMEADATEAELSDALISGETGRPLVPYPGPGALFPTNVWFDNASLAPPDVGDIAMTASFYETHGLVIGVHGEEYIEGPTREYGFGTPFSAWQARFFSVFRGDIAVFEYGDEQIVIMDTSKSEVGVIARGTGPVVLLDDE